MLSVLIFNHNSNAQSDSLKFSNSNSLMSISQSYQDNLSLKINGAAGRNLRLVKVFDIIGKEVASVEVASSNSASIYDIDLTSHKQNIFIFNLYSDKGLVESKKFLRTKSY